MNGACPRCGTANTSSDGFCGRCGLQLATQGTELTGRSPRPTSREQHRTYAARGVLVAWVALLIAVIIGTISHSADYYAYDSSGSDDVTINCGSAWSQNTTVPVQVSSECTAELSGSMKASSFLVLIALAFLASSVFMATRPEPTTVSHV